MALRKLGIRCICPERKDMREATAAGITWRSANSF